MGELESYTLHELAAAARMTARNVRAYQTRGLLPAPLRNGRTAVYQAGHLTRLAQIRLLRDAQVPLRMILIAVRSGEPLDHTSPLHRWANGPRPDVVRTGAEGVEVLIDPQVLDLVEEAVPGILDCLVGLDLVREHSRGLVAAGAVVELLLQLPTAAAGRGQLLRMIVGAAELSESLRGVISAEDQPLDVLPDGRRQELAHVAAVIVAACLTRPAKH